MALEAESSGNSTSVGQAVWGYSKHDHEDQAARDMEAPSRMSLSRSDGYRLSIGKEELALDAFSAFWLDQGGSPLERITEAEENYLFGDFRIGASTTIEVKGQPIDPYRYSQNFVEVFELTNNPRHVNGFTQLAQYLQVSEKVLSCIPVRTSNGTTVPLGYQKHVSVSITSMTSARWIAYVNVADGGTHLYLYESKELVDHIRRAVRKGFIRGAGNSNDDTFAVFVPLPKHRWERREGLWSYEGREDFIHEIMNIT